MRKLICLLMLVSLLGVTSIAMAQQPDGEKMTRELWAAMKATDMPALEILIAEGFQSVHCDGHSDRQGELDILKKLKPKDVVLSDFNVTSVSDSVIIVTYRVGVAETIKGERLADHAFPRMSVFVKTDKGWQWAAHANPRPLAACVIK